MQWRSLQNQVVKVLRLNGQLLKSQEVSNHPVEQENASKLLKLILKPTLSIDLVKLTTRIIMEEIQDVS
jgi:hypothetical protein